MVLREMQMASDAPEVPVEQLSPGFARGEVTWRLVAPGTAEIAGQFMDIMRGMDRNYAGGTVPEGLQLMTQEGCKYYVGEGAGCELALGYQWDNAREKYQIRTVGFRGDISPHEALRVMEGNLRRFMQEFKQTCVYAIVPMTMDNASIVQLHSLIPWYPGWRVTGGHHVSGGTYWRIEALDAAARGAVCT